MEVNKGFLKHEVNRDSYWMKLSLDSSDNRQTFLYLCVSYEYLSAKLKTSDLNEPLIQSWIDFVVSGWKLKGDVVFKKPFHFDVYALTSDGHLNGVSFLKTKVPVVS